MIKDIFFTLFDHSKKKRIGTIQISLNQNKDSSIRNFLSLAIGNLGQSFKGSKLYRSGGSFNGGIKLKSVTQSHLKKEEKCSIWIPDLGDIYKSSSSSGNYFNFSVNTSNHSLQDRPKLGHIKNLDKLQSCQGNILEIMDCGVIF